LSLLTDSPVRGGGVRGPRGPSQSRRRFACLL